MSYVSDSAWKNRWIETGMSHPDHLISGQEGRGNIWIPSFNIISLLMVSSKSQSWKSLFPIWDAAKILKKQQFPGDFMRFFPKPHNY